MNEESYGKKEKIITEVDSSTSVRAPYVSSGDPGLNALPVLQGGQQVGYDLYSCSKLGDILDKMFKLAQAIDYCPPSWEDDLELVNSKPWHGAHVTSTRRRNFDAK